MATYEAWFDPDDESCSCSTKAGVDDLRRRGLLGGKAQLLYSFEAATYEEAQALHNLRMGWGPYRPLGEPAPCPSCGAFYYPEGSGECWRCGKPPA